MSFSVLISVEDLTTKEIKDMLSGFNY